MNLFLDTSAIIKIYHNEKGTEKFSKYLSDLSEELFISTSDLTRIELHSALLKKFREKRISKNNLAKVFQLFDKDFQKFNIIAIEEFIKDNAILLLDNLGMKYSLKTLDSLQLASALYYNSYSKVDYFISADKKLLNAAKEFFKVINPEEL
ncbi:MAG: type II toxin-antitoxin system VapC family toxin [Ignavibacteria bacterium]|jgi:predicted nucleic acid-binding protein